MAGTKRVINIGTNADDGTGDLLRAAFEKVNQNFDDVWTYGAVNSNLNITADTIAGTTDVIVDPADSGAFKVAGDTIINPNNGNYNFTVNTDLANDVLYVKGSSGFVGIKNNAPTVPLDVTGDAKVSGTATLTTLSVTGNTTLGDSNTDTVNYVAKSSSDFLPVSTTQNLGGASNRWGNVFSTNLDVSGSISGTFTGNMTSTLAGDVNNTNVTSVNLNVTGPSNVQNLTVAGDLVVQGTTTTLETNNVLVNNQITFEGATADAHETILTVTEPTQDNTITFKNASGTVAFTSDIPTNINGLSDVDTQTTPPTNGQVLVWNNSNLEWEPGNVSSGFSGANVDTHLNQTNPTSGYVLSWNGSDYAWVAQSGGGGGMTDIVQDTTPQLGGTLDANGNTIDMGTNILTDTNLGQFITAHGWGNHASAGYLTSYTETNDLSSAVTWANIPDANVPASAVTQHQTALSITESQISDLGAYQSSAGLVGAIDAHLNQGNPTSGYVLSWNGSDYAWVSNGSASEVNDLTASVTWANIPDANVPASAVTQHQAALSVTESQISDLGTYLTSVPAQTFASLTGKPTTIAGYGITDGYANSDVDTHLNQSNPTSGYVLSWNGSDYAWVANGSGGGISNVVEDTTPQLGGNLDAQTFDITTTGKILYSNVYSAEGDLPSASTYHGMFAHVHGTGAGYFAHAGNWIKLANAATTLAGYGITDGYANSDVDTHLNQSNPTSGYVLSWNGSDYAWVAQTGSGTPGGATTQIQFNNAGSFDGDSDLTWTTGTNTLTVKNIVTESISANPTMSGTYTIASPTTITLDPVTEVILDAPMKLKSYTAASLPTASAGSVASVSDQGYKPAYYDGSDWRYFHDNSTV